MMNNNRTKKWKKITNRLPASILRGKYLLTLWFWLEYEYPLGLLAAINFFQDLTVENESYIPLRACMGVTL